MQLVCDLHIHSKHSRMTSPQMEPATISEWAQKKGVDIIATGDWTHPEWLEQLREELTPAEDGLFVLRDAGDGAPRFVLSGEIACVHPNSQSGARIRHMVLLPSFDAAETIATQLGWVGNLRAGGRPILKMHSEELLSTVFSVTEHAVVFPAHLWVPQLSVLGTGGFDRLEQCYGTMASQVAAVETGLSSDPTMNWRCSFLDTYTLLSNSDAHSPNTIGREVTVLDVPERSYGTIAHAIRNGNIVETVEFYPEEGRYHATGHSRCEVVMEDRGEIQEGPCPQCGKPLTVGVEGRVQRLADRPVGYRKEGAPPFRKILALDVIVGQALNVGPDTKTALTEYNKIIRALGSEYHVLREASVQDIANVSVPQIGEAVARVRDEEVRISPGYDGEFGSIEIFSPEERLQLSPQQSLFN